MRDQNNENVTPVVNNPSSSSTQSNDDDAVVPNAANLNRSITRPTNNNYNRVPSDNDANNPQYVNDNNLPIDDKLKYNM